MSPTHVRRSLALAALAAVACLSAPSLRADDAPAAPVRREPKDPVAEDPEAFVDYSSLSIALAEGGLPDGWTMIEPTAIEPDAEVLALTVRRLAADTAGADFESFQVVMRSVVVPGGAKAHYAYYDLGRPSPAFTAALAAAGVAKGFVTREMGTPRHGVAVSAPEAVRAKATEVAATFAVHLLAVAASSAQARGDGFRAIGLSRIALGIDGSLAPAHLIVGLGAKQIALLKNPKGDLGPAIEHLKASLAKGATKPLDARDTIVAKGNLGQAYLNQGLPSPEARDLLKEAVAGAAEINRGWGVAFRYDLACAHARLKELDEAFALLSGVLADIAKEPVEGIDEIWRKDVDFDHLRPDPRWTKLLDAYGAQAGAK